MGKYVWNFSQAEDLYNNLNKTATSALESVEKYQSKIKDTSSSWEGPAKDEFESSFETKTINEKNTVASVSLLAAFVKTSNDAIKDAEQKLSKLKI